MDSDNDLKDAGYDFYNEVLKSPKYVVAPMVEQSELAWRMLARSHGAELCYSPMYSANTFLNDTTYKKKVLEDISCNEDRPLVVQFCANTVEKFVNAALAVQDFCDAVDLNLGCPQHIARRGHFGAFLQNDWNLLYEMLSSCRKQLPIGVSAKIRIFPEISKTVEYAKLLERAGCHFITVHGRTINQKGPMTGKASWLHIKAVKQSLKIPVFANGNIQFAEDICRCLEETGADAVMSAEGHLSNPLIFEGKQPRVHEVVEEYFTFVQRFPCPVSCVRTHLFRLWAHALTVHKDMREKIGQAVALADIVRCNEELKKRCLQDEADASQQDQKESLPHWICQPYVRPNRKQNDATEKAESHSVNNTPSATKTISKNQQRRMLRYEKKLESKKAKRKREHERRKQRDKLMLSQLPDVQSDRILRKNEKKQIILNRMKAVMADDTNSLTVCVDLSWTKSMNEKEINKLAGQLGRLYGSNRNTENPAHLYFSSFSRDGKLWGECIRKHDGFESYLIDMLPEPYYEKFDGRDIVYLTPDATVALEAAMPGVVYVMGGLVDETVIKKLTLDGANERGFTTRRLPVIEHMRRMDGRANYSTVYSINQVFDMLLTFHSTGCWRQALAAGVPPRKGYVFASEFECKNNLNTARLPLDVHLGVACQVNSCAD